MRVLARSAMLSMLLASYPALAQESSVETLRKLIGTAPVTCTHNKECMCVKFSTKTNLPLKMTETQYCPVQADHHSIFNVTSWKDDWKVEEGQMDEAGPIGQWKNWHENGTLASTGNFVHGRQEGRFASWHPNGVMESEAFYHNGESVKTIRFWYDNGQLRVDGSYEDGKPQGIWNIYQRDGRLKEWRKFDHGKLIAKGPGKGS